MKKALILMYHNIDIPPKNARIPNLYVTPGMFRFQMAWLKTAGFKVLSLEDLLAAVASGPLPHNMAAITFDDGYLDFYRNAYSVLKEHGYPATVFIVSGLVGKESTWDSRKENFVKPLMDWSMIVELSRNGIQIGSHTKTHPELTRIKAAEQLSEMVDSKHELEERLNRAVDTFCYPGGDLDEGVKKLVHSAGYRYAVSTRRGHVTQDFDPFALRRIPIKLITNPLSFMYKIHTNSEKRKGRQT